VIVVDLVVNDDFIYSHLQVAINTYRITKSGFLGVFEHPVLEHPLKSS